MGSLFSSRTPILYLEEYENFLCAIDNFPLINNEFSFYLFTPTLANMSKFDILELWKT